MLLPPGKQYLWDIETTGLLPYLRENFADPVKSRVHILAIRDLVTRQTFIFRQNNRQNSIERGVKMLAEADLWVGHNLVGFDIPVMEMFYPELMAQANPIIRDSMVLSRVFFADEKERDFRRWKRGELEGKEIGRHGLEAWGQRLGMHKGDYAKAKAEEIKQQFPHLDKEEVTRLVWSEWNQEMEEYCEQDLNVNEALWQLMVANPRRHSDISITLEHRVHNLMEQVTNNGFPFDIEGGRELESKLREIVDEKEAACIAHFGSWWVPSKWKTIGKEYTEEVIDADGNRVLDADGKVKKHKVAFRPRTEFGEDNSRQNWGEITVPKKTMKFKPGSGKADKEAGCPYTPVELKEFNPGSRQQIIDRLTKVYGWEPQEFTETGQASVNDEILRDLAHTIPICVELAEIFYFNKRLGQLVDGKNGWIGKAMERGDGRIHPKFNVGGTVTNRASHSDPNIAQVPRVVFKKPLWFNEDGTPCLGPDGKQVKGRPVLDENGDFTFDEEGNIVTKKVLMKGREGDHGWDCRDLFYVPEGWVLMGADQKGIELRALGHFMAEYDDGEYGRKVIEADVHDLHAQAMEVDRDTAKTFVYATIYGAQDFKLGTVIDPALALKPQEAKRVGAEMRSRLMRRIPALGTVVKNIQRQARSGMLDALDGRKLFVRAQHAALNTLLQGAGATVAKQWCVNFAEYCEEDGLVHGWDGDFAILAWIHDELQVAVRDDPRIMAICQKNIIDAAYDAGMAFGFRLPVDVDVKFGRRWSETH